ncbi:MAG: hypothetical protein EHM70_23865 [Chloroflexota bacterium]|nr:MAG: hypothetical protein EHM70_23865 [Chloroflexota bacterium]
MLKNIKSLAIMLVVLSTILSACQVSRVTPTPAPTQNPNAVFTAAAQTAQAALTQMAQITPTTAVPTATETPTITPMPTIAITATAVVTPLATATQAPAGSTAQPSGPDSAQFVEDRTVPDGTDYAPQAAFVKTWRLMNNGTSTWTTGYSLVHVGGDALGGPGSVSLALDVPPNQTADISVNLVAPTAPGSYTSYWRMRNASGAYFGDSIYVLIDVVGSGTPVATSTPGGGTSGTIVTNATMAVDIADVTAECPHTFTFVASFTLSQASTVSYELEAGSDISGFTFDLPDGQTSSFPAGTQTLSFSLEITDTRNGWVRLKITSPENVTSNKANFSMTCQQ